MKKILLMLVCGLMLQTAANAQLVRFGIKAGAGTSSVKADDIATAFDSSDGIDNLKAKAEGATFSVQFGLMSRINIPLAPIIIQPELLFTSTGGKYTVQNVTQNLPEENFKETFSRVDIPVLLGYKIGPARLMIGPVASFVLSDGFSLGSINTAKSDFNTATWSGQIGLGVDLLNKLTLDLRYEGNLSKLGDSVNYGGKNFDFNSRQSQVLFSVGYFFGGK